jgi:ABC-type sugar transport system permease subunit
MLGLAILLALLLDQSRGLFSRICRIVYFLPYTIPTAIGGLIWGYMYSRHLSPFNLGSLISVLPLIAAFILLGKYWRGGLTAGATK